MTTVPMIAAVVYICFTAATTFTGSSTHLRNHFTAQLCERHHGPVDVTMDTSPTLFACLREFRLQLKLQYVLRSADFKSVAPFACQASAFFWLRAGVRKKRRRIESFFVSVSISSSVNFYLYKLRGTAANTLTACNSMHRRLLPHTRDRKVNTIAQHFQT